MGFFSKVKDWIKDLLEEPSITYIDETLDNISGKICPYQSVGTECNSCCKFYDVRGGYDDVFGDMVVFSEAYCSYKSRMVSHKE